MTISCARPGRIAGVVVTALSLTAALAAAASASTFTGQDAHARAVAGSPAASGDVMCLDHGSPLPDPLPNGARVYLSQCQDGDPDQVWWYDDGEIIAYDTIGVEGPMCLDVGTPPRVAWGQVYLWGCQGNPNQTWMADGGQVIVKDTFHTASPMCLATSIPLGSYGGWVYLWQCQDGNADPTWVIDGSQIIVKLTPF